MLRDFSFNPVGSTEDWLKDASHPACACGGENGSLLLGRPSNAHGKGEVESHGLSSPAAATHMHVSGGDEAMTQLQRAEEQLSTFSWTRPVSKGSLLRDEEL